MEHTTSVTYGNGSPYRCAVISGVPRVDKQGTLAVVEYNDDAVGGYTVLCTFRRNEWVSFTTSKGET